MDGSVDIDRFVRAFFARHDSRLLGGRLYALTGEYRTPLPLLRPNNNEWSVVPRPRDIHAMLGATHRALKAQGVARLDRRFFAVDRLPQERARCHVAMEARDPNGALVLMAESVYFMACIHSYCRIEMVEAVRLFPEDFYAAFRPPAGGPAIINAAHTLH
ncbi:hypothetical protein DXV76_15800 [Rhodobacteraceae bacterium CCMM004]|nr:hypothetical protein DXV76_15800 [Rhodobacteraceae bacterium CCMM004]